MDSRAMTAAALLAELATYSVTVERHGDRLCMRAPKAPPDELVERVRDHKPELLAMLPDSDVRPVLHFVLPDYAPGAVATASSAGSALVASSAAAPYETLPEVEERRGVRWWTWTGLGTSAALLVGSGVLELTRRQLEDQARENPESVATERKLDAMDSRKTAARVLVGIGAGVAVLSGVSLYLDLGSSRSESTLSPADFLEGLAALAALADLEEVSCLVSRVSSPEFKPVKNTEASAIDKPTVSAIVLPPKVMPSTSGRRRLPLQAGQVTTFM